MKRVITSSPAIAALLIGKTLFAQPETGPHLSLLNGINSFANSSSKDSVYFLKGGINLGLQGNYFWKSIGLAGRIGYFNNNPSDKKIADFALSRKATADRALIASKPYKGIYWMAGPAFQTTFSRWQVESNVLGGLFHHDDAGVFIGDRVSPDLVYYRNKMEAGSAFAWNVGFGLNYAVSAPIRIGISADYMSTQTDVVNTDINRNNGTSAQSLTSQANFLSTALKLTYALNRGNYDNRNTWRKSTVKSTSSNPGKISPVKNGTAPATQKSNDCDCENKPVDISFLEPLTIDIAFPTLAEAQKFLKTSNPLYQQNGNAGENPLYTRREAGSGLATGRRQYKPVIANYDDVTNTVELDGKHYAPATREAGSGLATGRRQHEPMKSSFAGNTDVNENNTPRGMMVRTGSGEQVFAVLPSLIDLVQVSYLEGGAISVHVKNDNAAMQLKAQNNNTVRSNRTDNALVSNNNLDSTGNSTQKVADHNSSRSNKSSSLIDTDNDGTSGEEELLDVVLYTDAAGKTSAKVFRNKLNNGRYTTREAGSGLATGRRMHKPMAVLFDEENGEIDIDGTIYREVTTTREAGSGIATGRRSTIAVRLVAGDEATTKAIISNNPHRSGSTTLNSQTSSTRQTQGSSFGEKLVAGDPIPGLDVILKTKSGGQVVTSTDENGFIIANSIAEGEYEVDQVYKGTWRYVAGDSNKILTHVHGDPHVDTKAGYSTISTNGAIAYKISTAKPVRCHNGQCELVCTVIIDGKEHEATVTAVVKSKHDSQMGAIQNIR